MTRIRVWDLPTRFFHWLFALAFAAAYVLGESEGLLGWHTYFGYLAAGLVLFRLVWGATGERYSRFRDFPLSPSAALAYLKSLRAGEGERHVGHNPAGAVAIYALLGLGLAVALSGVALLAADKGLGPLGGMLPHAWEHSLEEVHEFFTNAMLLLVLAHIGGVVLGSLRHKENLPRAMVTGYKEAGPDHASVRLRAGVAAAMFVAIAAFTALHDFSGGCADAPAICAEEEEGHDD
jgi:cytochrome b